VQSLNDGTAKNKYQRESGVRRRIRSSTTDRQRCKRVSSAVTLIEKATAASNLSYIFKLFVRMTKSGRSRADSDSAAKAASELNNNKEGLEKDCFAMPPPPSKHSLTGVASTSTDTPFSSSLLDSTSDRHMNDTTIPPSSRRFENHKISSQKKAVAVNPLVRGPRFGLHDWKRLLAASKDLAQLKGQPPRCGISLEEIKSHNKNHDGWVILRGKVYNIGPYLPYHPGGMDIFKHVLGKDATSMFDKYHRWVNIDGLIGALFIGTAASLAKDGTGTKTDNVFPDRLLTDTRAPRVHPAKVASTSLLSCKDNDNDDDDSEKEEDLLPPSSG
jgi:cytochrome b involved in lipid metabolism